jgi:hypothetical protein
MQGMLCRAKVRDLQGMARQARHGAVMSGRAWFGKVRQARLGGLVCGSSWYGMVRFG